MFGYITAQEAARKWGITIRRVQVLCLQGRIVGAVKHGCLWAIPVEAEKPSDGRFGKKDKNSEV